MLGPSVVITNEYDDTCTNNDSVEIIIGAINLFEPTIQN